MRRGPLDTGVLRRTHDQRREASGQRAGGAAPIDAGMASRQSACMARVPHAGSGGSVDPATASPWSRTPTARRFGREIVALIVLKVVLLTLLWMVAIRPAPRADTAPPSVARHLVSPPADSAPRP